MLASVVDLMLKVLLWLRAMFLHFLHFTFFPYFFQCIQYLHLFQNSFPLKLDTALSQFIWDGRFSDLLKKPERNSIGMLICYIAAGLQTCSNTGLFTS